MEVIYENDNFNEQQDYMNNDHWQKSINIPDILELHNAVAANILNDYYRIPQFFTVQFIFDASRNLVLNSTKSIVADFMNQYREPITYHNFHILNEIRNNVNISPQLEIQLIEEEYNEYKIILHFLHENELTISCLSDAIRCYRIAHTVGIPIFKLACVDYLLQHITCKNVVNIYDKLVRSTNLPVHHDRIRWPDPYLERIANIYYTRNSMKAFHPLATLMHVNEDLQSHEIIDFEINLPIQIYGIVIYCPTSSDWKMKSVEVEISMKEDCYFSEAKVVKRNIYNINNNNNGNVYEMYKIYFDNDVTIRPNCLYKLCVNYDTSIPFRGTTFYSGWILKNKMLHTEYTNNYNKVIDSSLLSINYYNKISRIQAIYYKSFPQLLTFDGFDGLDEAFVEGS